MGCTSKVQVWTLFASLFIIAISSSTTAAANNNFDLIGVNWGTQAAQSLDPKVIIQMLKDNDIKKIKLFDSDHWTVKQFASTGIQVMLGIPNNQLKYLTDYDNAQEWVKQNVSKHMYKGGVDIKYVAVGNEPFLKSYNGSNLKTVFPALKNVQKALDESGYGKKIKATIPQNADVYTSDLGGPSKGHFRDDIKQLMHDIVTFLKDNDAPFIVNIYPFLSLYENPDFPIEFAFFEGGAKPVQDKNIQYTNMYDANLDTLVWSMRKAGAPKVDIIVGEIGWPTDGHKSANSNMAKKFYNGFFKKMATKKGTPLHPGAIEVYLFGLVDENMKSVAPGFFERHWGIFGYDGTPKFELDITGTGNEKMPIGAKNVTYLEKQWCVFDSSKNVSSKELQNNVEFACGIGDCTSLGGGGSCNGLDEKGNISYAFNMYFQMMNQDVEACDFDGFAKIVKKNVSTKQCLFPLALESGGRRLGFGGGPTTIVINAAIIFISLALLF